MSRTARIVVPGLPHHLTQRGNRGQPVFFTDRDRQRYLVWLAEGAARYGLRVWAYCLMTNHVHLVVVPTGAHSLARALSLAHTKYAQALNAENGWDGHLWQGRFFSCALDDEHLWSAVRYVERNPVRAGLVEHASQYAWSNAPAHCGSRADPALAPDLPLLRQIDDWPAWLEESEDVVVLDRIRDCTASGRPCGGETFSRDVNKGQSHASGRLTPARDLDSP